MIKYEWIINSMNCTPSLDGLTNVVTMVHWRYKGTTEEGITDEIYGVLSVGQPSPDNFIDYQNLTFEQVCGWLETIYSQETLPEETQLSSMKKIIADKINLILNPQNIILPLPFYSEDLNLPLPFYSEDLNLPLPFYSEDLN